MPTQVLIVDDVEQVRTFVSLALRRAGYAVMATANAEDAMRLCATESFDLVLSDVLMPGMDGHKLVRWIAANYPRTRTALMSGFDSAGGESDGPGCLLLRKPFTAHELAVFVARVLAS